MSFTTKLKKSLESEGRSSVVIRNVLASVGIKGISMITSFALIPLTIGYVSPDLYGVWLTLSSILTWMSFLDIGFSQGLKNKLTEAIAYEDWTKGKLLVSTTYFVMISIFVPLCVILEIIVPFIDWCSLLNVSSEYGDEISDTMCVLIAMGCLQMIVNVLVSVVAAFQKVALSNSFVPFGNIISLVIIYTMTKTVAPSLISLAFSLSAMPILVIFIASIILFVGKFKAVSPNVFFVRKCYVKELFGLGYKFFIINIQAIVLYQSTNFLISNVSTPLEVTRYNVAYKLLSISMMFYSIFTAPLWPAYTDAYARDDYAWMNKTRDRMKKILLISMLVTSLAAFFSPFLYSVWIGSSVEVPMVMTVLVAIYVSIYCWTNMNGTIIVAMSKVKLNVIILVLGMFIHIPFSYVLSMYFGCYGVILSMTGITLFYAIIYHVQVNKLLKRTATGIWNA